MVRGKWKISGIRGTGDKIPGLMTNRQKWGKGQRVLIEPFRGLDRDMKGGEEHKQEF